MNNMEELSEEELERYDRQLSIQGFGKEEQIKLKKSHVILPGIGGLGSSISIYLVAAGVGRLTIVDPDTIELGNLNRQIIHWNTDIGRTKIESAMEKLRSLNPNTEIKGVNEEINSENVNELLDDSDIVVDGLDNFSTRYIINKACVEKNIPYIHGAVEGLIGQISTIIPGKGPCLKCIFPSKPMGKSVIPVLGVTPGTVGCIEAMEVIKIITGIGNPLIGRMLIFNGEELEFSEIQVSKNMECEICGDI